VATNRQGAYLVGMPTNGVMTDADPSTPRKETAEEREQRIAREAEMIAEARASVAAGRVVSLEAVSAWVDSWDTDHELPPPRSGR
jgi:predicted transcriptional regulator